MTSEPPDQFRLFKALVLAHAVAFRSRKRSKRAVRRCRQRRLRSLAILKDGQLSPIVSSLGVSLSSRDAEELRDAAALLIRNGCAECQLCDRFRFTRP